MYVISLFFFKYVEYMECVLYTCLDICVIIIILILIVITIVRYLYYSIYDISKL